MENNRNTVTTYSGKIAYENECHLFPEGYFIIGNEEIENSGECYKINNKFYKSNTGYIIYNHSVNRYEIKNISIHIEGIISCHNDKLQTGWFNNSFMFYLKNIEKMIPVLNYKIFNNNKFIKFNYDQGYFELVENKKVNSFLHKKHIDYSVKSSLSYDCSNIIDDYVKSYKKHSKNFIISENVKKYYKNLNGLSFGVEFETSKGYIKPEICKKVGLIPLRDGSIDGLEYVTVPLQGKEGLESLKKSTELLDFLTETNDSCSLHYHIGNIPRTEEFIIALFRLLVYNQREIFDMFPVYKEKNFKVKRKAYTKPLDSLLLLDLDSKITEDNIKENFDVLYRFFSGGLNYASVNNDLNNIKCHPSDPRGTRKWNIKSRYYWVNFVPLIFGNKKTIEFRIHTSTTDTNKVINFLYIIAGLINFAKKNQKSLLKDNKLKKLTLSEILNFTYPNSLSKNLYKYVNFRKEITNAYTKENIVINEEKYNYFSNIDWESFYNLNVLNKKNTYSDDLESLRNVIMEEFREPPTPITNSI